MCDSVCNVNNVSCHSSIGLHSFYINLSSVYIFGTQKGIILILWQILKYRTKKKFVENQYIT